MNFSYAVVAGASVVAGTALVDVGASFGDNVRGDTEAVAIEQPLKVGSNAAAASQGVGDGCYGEYVVQLIAYPSTTWADWYVSQMAPHAQRGVYYFRNSNGHYVVNANAGTEADARALLGHLRGTGVPMDPTAFVRTRSNDDPCFGRSSMAASAPGLTGLVTRSEPTRVAPSTYASTVGSRSAFAVVAAYSDAQLLQARARARQRLAQLESGSVAFTANTRDEIRFIISMDALLAEELRNRGHQAEPAVQASKHLQIASAVIDQAYRHIGKPYVYPSTGRNRGPEGFDCSGLTSVVYRDGAGLRMNSYSQDQLRNFEQVSLSDRKPGDLIGRRVGYGEVGHVALYIGGGLYIDAAAGSRMNVGVGSNHYEATSRPWTAMGSVAPAAQIHAQTLSADEARYMLSAYTS